MNGIKEITAQIAEEFGGKLSSVDLSYDENVQVQNFLGRAEPEILEGHIVERITIKLIAKSANKAMQLRIQWESAPAYDYESPFQGAGKLVLAALDIEQNPAPRPGVGRLGVIGDPTYEIRVGLQFCVS